MRPLPVLLAALSLCASSCGPVASEWDRRGAEAARAFAASRWEDAARALEAQVALAPSRPADPAAAEALDRRVRESFYNLACARARLGKAESALDALEQAMRDGAGSIGFDHLVRDPDLAGLHGTERWKALIQRLSWNEEVVFGSGGPSPSAATVLVIWIGPDRPREDEERMLPGPVGAWSVFPTPPYLVAPGVHAWRTLLEPGARAAEKAAFTVDRYAQERTVTRILAARGEEFVRVAWEVLLREPKAFTHAVLDGPTPPAWALLDRGAEKVAARVITVEEAGTLEEAFRRAVR